MQPRAVRPERARQLRGTPTDAELKLWQRIRKKQLPGHRFRRQVPLGSYVVDFACIERSLIVEVDGGQHSLQQKRDEKRTAWLEAHGSRVVRFWNNEVLGNIEGVLERLALELGADAALFPPPPPAGEDRGGGSLGSRRPSIGQGQRHLPPPCPPPLAGEGETAVSHWNPR
jgi:very-short-patch-repair endonuclease